MANHKATNNPILSTIALESRVNLINRPFTRKSTPGGAKLLDGGRGLDFGDIIWSFLSYKRHVSLSVHASLDSAWSSQGCQGRRAYTHQDVDVQSTADMPGNMTVEWPHPRIVRVNLHDDIAVVAPVVGAQ